jgi:hypothetical protein
MAEEFDVDEILRVLHRRLSACSSNSEQSAHIAGLIGPIVYLYRHKPINAIHEQRLRDFLKLAMAAINNTRSPSDD